jgi:hypothetical protein
MLKPIRVEIKGRNAFWENAVQVEWAHQFPDRRLASAGDKIFVIEAAWLEDLQRVTHQCFSSAVIAPEDFGKRRLLRKLFAGSEDA